MTSINVLAQEAAAQQGLLTTQQLLRIGETEKSIRTLVRKGLVERVHRGVYAVFGSSKCWEHAVMAAVLAGDRKAVASHRSALGLLGLWPRGRLVELTVRYPRHLQVANAIVHRSHDLRESDVCVVDGIPTTKIDRTLCDVGLLIGFREIRRLTFHAVATGLTTRAALEGYVEEVGRQGRNGVGPMRLVLDELPGVRADSGPELELFRLLAAGGLPRPVSQFEVELDRRVYRVDFAYPNVKVAIEYDGLAPHTMKVQFERDRQRQNAFVINGWMVLRFTAADLRDRPASVIAEVRAAIRRVS